jgi:hypothetical protein
MLNILEAVNNVIINSQLHMKKIKVLAFVDETI